MHAGSEKLTESDLRSAFFNRFRDEFLWIFPNAALNAWECDLLAVHPDGRATEWEIKRSRADFKNDRKKSRPSIPGVEDRPDTKFDALCAGFGPNYFGYLVPEGLITADDLPPFAGWMTYNPLSKTLTLEKPPAALHPEPLSPAQLSRLIGSVYQRFWKYKTGQEISDTRVDELRKERDRWERRYHQEVAFREKHAILTDGALREALRKWISGPGIPENIRHDLQQFLNGPEF